MTSAQEALGHPIDPGPRDPGMEQVRNQLQNMAPIRQASKAQEAQRQDLIQSLVKNVPDEPPASYIPPYSNDISSSLDPKLHGLSPLLVDSLNYVNDEEVANPYQYWERFQIEELVEATRGTNLAPLRPIAKIPKELRGALLSEFRQYVGRKADMTRIARWSLSKVYGENWRDVLGKEKSDPAVFRYGEHGINQFLETILMEDAFGLIKWAGLEGGAQRAGQIAADWSKRFEDLKGEDAQKYLRMTVIQEAYKARGLTDPTSLAISEGVGSALGLVFPYGLPAKVIAAGSGIGRGTARLLAGVAGSKSATIRNILFKGVKNLDPAKVGGWAKTLPLMPLRAERLLGTVIGGGAYEYLQSRGDPTSAATGGMTFAGAHLVGSLFDAISSKWIPPNLLVRSLQELAAKGSAGAVLGHLPSFGPKGFETENAELLWKQIRYWMGSNDPLTPEEAERYRASILGSSLGFAAIGLAGAAGQSARLHRLNREGASLESLTRTDPNVRDEVRKSVLNLIKSEWIKRGQEKPGQHVEWFGEEGLVLEVEGKSPDPKDPAAVRLAGEKALAEAMMEKNPSRLLMWAKYLEALGVAARGVDGPRLRRLANWIRKHTGLRTSETDPTGAYVGTFQNSMRLLFKMRPTPEWFGTRPTITREQARKSAARVMSILMRGVGKVPGSRWEEPAERPAALPPPAEEPQKGSAFDIGPGNSTFQAPARFESDAGWVSDHESVGETRRLTMTYMGPEKGAQGMQVFVEATGEGYQVAISRGEDTRILGKVNSAAQVDDLVSLAMGGAEPGFVLGWRRAYMDGLDVEAHGYGPLEWLVGKRFTSEPGDGPTLIRGAEAAVSDVDQIGADPEAASDVAQALRDAAVTAPDAETAHTLEDAARFVEAAKGQSPLEIESGPGGLDAMRSALDAATRLNPEHRFWRVSLGDEGWVVEPTPEDQANVRLGRSELGSLSAEDWRVLGEDLRTGAQISDIVLQNTQTPEQFLPEKKQVFREVLPIVPGLMKPRPDLPMAPPTRMTEPVTLKLGQASMTIPATLPQIENPPAIDMVPVEGPKRAGTKISNLIESYKAQASPFTFKAEPPTLPFQNGFEAWMLASPPVGSVVGGIQAESVRSLAHGGIPLLRMVRKTKVEDGTLSNFAISDAAFARGQVFFRLTSDNDAKKRHLDVIVFDGKGFKQVSSYDSNAPFVDSIAEDAMAPGDVPKEEYVGGVGNTEEAKLAEYVALKAMEPGVRYMGLGSLLRFPMYARGMAPSTSKIFGELMVLEQMGSQRLEAALSKAVSEGKLDRALADFILEWQSRTGIRPRLDSTLALTQALSFHGRGPKGIRGAHVISMASHTQRTFPLHLTIALALSEHKNPLDSIQVYLHEMLHYYTHNVMERADADKIRDLFMRLAPDVYESKGTPDEFVSYAGSRLLMEAMGLRRLDWPETQGFFHDRALAEDAKDILPQVPKGEAKGWLNRATLYIQNAIRELNEAVQYLQVGHLDASRPKPQPVITSKITGPNQTPVDSSMLLEAFQFLQRFLSPWDEKFARPELGVGDEVARYKGWFEELDRQMRTQAGKAEILYHLRPGTPADIPLIRSLGLSAELKDWAASALESDARRMQEFHGLKNPPVLRDKAPATLEEAFQDPQNLQWVEYFLSDPTYHNWARTWLQEREIYKRLENAGTLDYIRHASDMPAYAAAKHFLAQEWWQSEDPIVGSNIKTMYGLSFPMANCNPGKCAGVCYVVQQYTKDGYKLNLRGINNDGKRTAGLILQEMVNVNPDGAAIAAAFSLFRHIAANFKAAMTGATIEFRKGVKEKFQKFLTQWEEFYGSKESKRLVEIKKLIAQTPWEEAARAFAGGPEQPLEGDRPGETAGMNFYVRLFDTGDFLNMQTVRFVNGLANLLAPYKIEVQGFTRKPELGSYVCHPNAFFLCSIDTHPMTAMNAARARSMPKSFLVTDGDPEVIRRTLQLYESAARKLGNPDPMGDIATIFPPQDVVRDAENFARILQVFRDCGVANPENLICPCDAGLNPVAGSCINCRSLGARCMGSSMRQVKAMRDGKVQLIRRISSPTETGIQDLDLRQDTGSYLDQLWRYAHDALPESMQPEAFAPMIHDTNVMTHARQLEVILQDITDLEDAYAAEWALQFEHALAEGKMARFLQAQITTARKGAEPGEVERAVRLAWSTFQMYVEKGQRLAYGIAAARDFSPPIEGKLLDTVRDRVGPRGVAAWVNATRISRGDAPPDVLREAKGYHPKTASALAKSLDAALKKGGSGQSWLESVDRSLTKASLPDRAALFRLGYWAGAPLATTALNGEPKGFPVTRLLEASARLLEASRLAKGPDPSSAHELVLEALAALQDPQLGVLLEDHPLFAAAVRAAEQLKEISLAGKDAATRFQADVAFHGPAEDSASGIVSRINHWLKGHARFLPQYFKDFLRPTPHDASPEDTGFLEAARQPDIAGVMPRLLSVLKEAEKLVGTDVAYTLSSAQMRFGSHMSRLMVDLFGTKDAPFRHTQNRLESILLFAAHDTGDDPFRRRWMLDVLAGGAEPLAQRSRSYEELYGYLLGLAHQSLPEDYDASQEAADLAAMLHGVKARGLKGPDLLARYGRLTEILEGVRRWWLERDPEITALREKIGYAGRVRRTMAHRSEYYQAIADAIPDKPGRAAILQAATQYDRIRGELYKLHSRLQATQDTLARLHSTWEQRDPEYRKAERELGRLGKQWKALKAEIETTQAELVQLRALKGEKGAPARNAKIRDLKAKLRHAETTLNRVLSGISVQEVIYFGRKRIAGKDQPGIKRGVAALASIQGKIDALRAEQDLWLERLAKADETVDDAGRAKALAEVAKAAAKQKAAAEEIDELQARIDERMENWGIEVYMPHVFTKDHPSLAHQSGWRRRVAVWLLGDRATVSASKFKQGYASGRLALPKAMSMRFAQHRTGKEGYTRDPVFALKVYLRSVLGTGYINEALRILNPLVNGRSSPASREVLQPGFGWDPQSQSYSGKLSYLGQKARVMAVDETPDGPVVHVELEGMEGTQALSGEKLKDLVERKMGLMSLVSHHNQRYWQEYFDRNVFRRHPQETDAAMFKRVLGEKATSWLYQALLGFAHTKALATNLAGGIGMMFIEFGLANMVEGLGKVLGAPIKAFQRARKDGAVEGSLINQYVSESGVHAPIKTWANLLSMGLFTSAEIGLRTVSYSIGYENAKKYGADEWSAHLAGLKGVGRTQWIFTPAMTPRLFSEKGGGFWNANTLFMLWQYMLRFNNRFLTISKAALMGDQRAKEKMLRWFLVAHVGPYYIRRFLGLDLRRLFGVGLDELPAPLDRVGNKVLDLVGWDPSWMVDGALPMMGPFDWAGVPAVMIADTISTSISALDGDRNAWKRWLSRYARMMIGRTAADALDLVSAKKPGPEHELEVRYPDNVAEMFGLESRTGATKRTGTLWDLIWTYYGPGRSRVEQNWWFMRDKLRLEEEKARGRRRDLTEQGLRFLDLMAQGEEGRALEVMNDRVLPMSKELGVYLDWKQLARSARSRGYSFPPTIRSMLTSTNPVAAMKAMIAFMNLAVADKSLATLPVEHLQAFEALQLPNMKKNPPELWELYNTARKNYQEKLAGRW